MRAGEFQNHIGVFDSGVGGISILRALVRELPSERFVYFGDSAHAPYGEKTPCEVLDLSRDITQNLVNAGCKAVVIACNTATSAAVAALRLEYPDLPIVGVEPALKPAVLSMPVQSDAFMSVSYSDQQPDNRPSADRPQLRDIRPSADQAPLPDGRAMVSWERRRRVLVMATPMTVALDKFQQLMHDWGKQADVVAVPCAGLAARIEQGNLDAPDVRDLVGDLVGEYAGTVDAVVLGCTHYPFVANQIRAVLGDVPFFDSAAGTARQLHRLLAQRGLLNGAGNGSVHFLSSKNTSEELALYRRFYSMPIV